MDYQNPPLTVRTACTTPADSHRDYLAIVAMSRALAEIDGLPPTRFSDVTDALKQCVVIVAETTEDVCGMVAIDQCGPGARLSHFYVKPTAPRKTAQRLMQAVGSYLKSFGVEEVRLVCTDDNPAHSAYINGGFKPFATEYRAKTKDVIAALEERKRWAQ